MGRRFRGLRLNSANGDRNNPWLRKRGRLPYIKTASLLLQVLISVPYRSTTSLKKLDMIIRAAGRSNIRTEKFAAQTDVLERSSQQCRAVLDFGGQRTAGL